MNPDVFGLGQVRNALCSIPCDGGVAMLVNGLSRFRAVGALVLAVWILHAAPAWSMDALEDDLFWEGSGGCQNIKGARLYLENLPEGRHAAEAAGCIAWDAIKDCENRAPVERFLRNHAESQYAREARECLARLEAENRRQALVERLLSECRAHQEASRLTVGSGGNALACYRTVLDEDPGNEQALAGITSIEQHYADKADAALEGERPDAAEASIARLEAINPEHPSIETLRARVSELRAKLVELAELRREIEALLAQGRPEEARSRLAAGRKRVGSDKALDDLGERVEEAATQADLVRALEEKTSAVRALVVEGKVGEARELLSEARADGLDEETGGELEAAIWEAEARREAAARAAEVRRLLEECGGHVSAKRFAAALRCYREVLALEPGHSEAAVEVRRFEPLAAWDEAEGKETVEGYHDFEQAHADSPFASLARLRLEELEAEYWASVQEAGTPEAYGRYLEIYPEGRFAALAKHRASRGE